MTYPGPLGPMYRPYLKRRPISYCWTTVKKVRLELESAAAGLHARESNMVLIDCQDEPTGGSADVVVILGRLG